MIKGDSLFERLAAQFQWIDKCGGDEAGYVKRYGAASDPQHYGSGGEAIFKADHDALIKLIEEASRYRPRLARR